MAFVRLEEKQVFQLWSLFKRSRIFPTLDVLKDFMNRGESYIYYSDVGIVAVVGRWRKHLRSLVIWEIIPADKAKSTVIKELVSSVKELGFSMLLSPLLTKRELDPYYSAGFRKIEAIARLEKHNFIIPETEEIAELRQAKREDLEELLEIEKRIFPPFWWLEEENFAQFLVGHHFLVALLKGSIVGYNINNVLKNQGVIYRLGVEPVYQRKGIGSQLLAEAVRWFKGKDVRLITLTAQMANKSGIELYKKFGFKVLSEQLYILGYNF